MPRYFCDYCNTYLTHDSQAGRKQHLRGWKHRENVKQYYEPYANDPTTWPRHIMMQHASRGGGFQGMMPRGPPGFPPFCPPSGGKGFPGMMGKGPPMGGKGPPMGGKGPPMGGKGFPGPGGMMMPPSPGFGMPPPRPGMPPQQ